MPKAPREGDVLDSSGDEKCARTKNLAQIRRPGFLDLPLEACPSEQFVPGAPDGKQSVGRPAGKAEHRAKRDTVESRLEYSAAIEDTKWR